VFAFEDGLMATHVCIGCAVGSQTSWNGDWRIEGPQGSITWDKDKMWHTHLHRVETRINQEIFPLNVPPNEQAMLDEFFAAIRENREPECSARQPTVIAHGVRCHSERERKPESDVERNWVA